ncbi:type II toxin-antitoxin system CcdA family antitoxin [Bartonella choladocola]|uniref:Antitoxin CcdA n=1 Tax=Bartonella choladocola TaxID=2750995 RepID=A0A1U9MJD3_9HYPH|nr:type II toxin-antitoxin system CcdA family antitoxin [Bartonella choladocola]AQT47966.1 antitoxin CcdA [Bartonella choladocola]
MVAAQLKKPVNLSLSEEVLKEARSMKINMSKAAEDGIIKALAHEKAERWKRENAAALESSNEYVEKHGLPLARYRQF